MNKSEKLLVNVLLENLKPQYIGIKYDFSEWIEEWEDESGSFDFCYFPKKEYVRNVIGTIAQICFYDVDKVLCEAVLGAYKDEPLLCYVDILKFSEEPLISIPSIKEAFCIIT